MKNAIVWKTKMKIGIVGSRKREDKESVFELVNSLDKDDIVVSGGCKGVDNWAVRRARERGLKTIVFKPDLQNIKHHGDMVQRYYDRNQKVAKEVDILYAFVSEDRSGGTENTIMHATRFGKEVVIK